MQEAFIRTAMLLGEDGINRLQQARVAVFGIGGVGGHAVEALVRAGVGAIDLIDNDVVSPSNLNRQLVAVRHTIGRYKTEVMRERIQNINPSCEVMTYTMFYLPQEKQKIPFAEYDYILDAIDTVTAKLDLITEAQERHIPIISSMGTGNKLDPTQLEVADIYQTSVCPLAKVMRKELKARGIPELKVVYSKEPPRTPVPIPGYEEEKRSRVSGRPVPGSTSFVPAAAGLIMAGEVIKDLAQVQ